MTVRLMHALSLGCLISLAGCGGSSGPKLPKPVKVNGVVALDSQPVGNAIVFFAPEGGSQMGNGASGVTDDKGVYELVTAAGKVKQPGAIPGSYRVFISRLVDREGKAVAPNADVAPANMGAVESLPPRYSDLMQTELRASVSQEGGKFDFSITSR